MISFAQDAGFEYSEQIIGKSDFEMRWKDQAELYRADDFRVMELGNSILGYEESQTTPDGNLIWLRTSKAPLIDTSTGETIGILGIYDDISEDKKAAEKLKESEESFRSLFKELQKPFMSKMKMVHSWLSVMVHRVCINTQKNGLSG